MRSPEKLPESWKNNDLLSITSASVLDISEDEMAALLLDCTSVASCLGHNMSFKGIYGAPQKLVTDTVNLLCNAIKKNAPKKQVKFVLMNTTGNSNRYLDEPISSGQKLVIGLLRLILPPHVDNENAADYLRINIGQSNNFIEWVAVRPDGLVNEEVTEYELHPSPTRSAIFDAGKISRINIGNFMARLITDNDLWSKWQGKMPVVYNKESQKTD